MVQAHKAWAGRPHWCVLDTAFAGGLEFLRSWQAWRQDPRRPGLLHVAAIEPFPPGAGELQASLASGITPGLPAELTPLARQLAAQWWGLTPGLHRLAFENGRVLLSLLVGLPADALRELSFTADEIRLAPSSAAAPRGEATLRALARLCRRGTRLIATAPDAPLRHELATAGFIDLQDDGPLLRASYDPPWAPRTLRTEAPAASDAVVIGGGLAGASAAAALALRGWQVEVLDRCAEPAGGASGLPAGLMAPHLSPDDSLLSRLSRSGIRITLQHAQDLLREGVDWQGGGTLEHRARAQARTLDTQGFAADWSRPASAAEKQDALLPEEAPAAWHPRAAWIRPGALVRAWLGQPGIRWRGGLPVDRVVRGGRGWQLLDAQGAVLADAPLVVIAAALGSAALAHQRLYLQPVRGQVSWALRDRGMALPNAPVNGNGHFLPAVPLEGDGGLAWMCGSSYGRGDTRLDERQAEHMANFDRLQALLPLAAAQLAPVFAAGRVRAWTGVRCASTDRRPLVGELAPGLWASTAMGSRGLSFAALCAELLAARLHQQPLPLPLSLASGLDLRRQLPAQSGT